MNIKKITVFISSGCCLGEVIRLLELITPLIEPMNLKDCKSTSSPLQIYSLCGGIIFSPSSSLIFMDSQRIKSREVFQSDILIITHSKKTDDKNTELVSDWLRAACPRAKQIVALGSGTLTLAKAGLLNRRSVTTHTAAAASLAKEYPLLRVDPLSALKIDGNIITTSENVNLLDLANVLLEAAYPKNHHHVPCPKKCSNLMLVTDVPPIDIRPNSISHRIILWWIKHIDENITMEDSASFLSMSERNFRRHFKTEVEYPPYLFLLLMRLELARQALVDSNLPVDKIARRGGLNDGQQLARVFRKFIITSPHKYRMEATTGQLPLPHPSYSALFNGQTIPFWLRELQIQAKGDF